ncbi:hypothetical protein [Paenibacillus sp. FSL K6-1318]|uniref:hypothetical protein n=1 Tax=Paenibacillus sp. FSL K6-1318 TaxID=2975291 RepID=UPI0030EE37A7
MRQFGLTYDDAVDLQVSLVAGLRAQKRYYDWARHDLNSMEKKIAKTESKRTMKKIAFLNGFTKAKTKAEIKELGKLVVE